MDLPAGGLDPPLSDRKPNQACYMPYSFPMHCANRTSVLSEVFGETRQKTLRCEMNQYHVFLYELRKFSASLKFLASGK